MIRVIVFLVAVSLAALGVAWFADRPGEVAVVWRGWRVETSLMVGAVAILTLVTALIFVWSMLRGNTGSAGVARRGIWRFRAG